MYDINPGKQEYQVTLVKIQLWKNQKKKIQIKMCIMWAYPLIIG